MPVGPVGADVGDVVGDDAVKYFMISFHGASTKLSLHAKLFFTFLAFYRKYSTIEKKNINEKFRHLQKYL